MMDHPLRQIMKYLTLHQLIVLKLITGEQILSLIAKEDEVSYMLKFPMLMKSIQYQTEFGIQDLEMPLPWMVATEGRLVTIEKSKVVVQRPMSSVAADIYFSAIEKYDFGWLFDKFEKEEATKVKEEAVPEPTQQEIDDLLSSLEVPPPTPKTPPSEGEILPGQ